ARLGKPRLAEERGDVNDPIRALERLAHDRPVADISHDGGNTYGTECVRVALRAHRGAHRHSGCGKLARHVTADETGGTGNDDQSVTSCGCVHDSDPLKVPGLRAASRPLNSGRAGAANRTRYRVPSP